MINDFFHNHYLFIAQMDTDGTEIFTPLPPAPCDDPDSAYPDIWLPIMT